jgi:hypothetical protein
MPDQPEQPKAFTVAELLVDAMHHGIVGQTKRLFEYEFEDGSKLKPEMIIEVYCHEIGDLVSTLPRAARQAFLEKVFKSISDRAENYARQHLEQHLGMALPGKKIILPQ